MKPFVLKRAPAHAVALAGLCCLITGCHGTSQPVSKTVFVGDVGVGTWVAIEPTQCRSNPWEQDWLAQHDDDYDGYPADDMKAGLEPEEFAIITDYYARQGVEVRAGATAPRYEDVCKACFCVAGHTMFLQVRESDVETMISFGYRVEEPPSLSDWVLGRLLGSRPL